jgi:hypothetical protein
LRGIQWLVFFVASQVGLILPGLLPLNRWKNFQIQCQS